MKIECLDSVVQQPPGGYTEPGAVTRKGIVKKSKSDIL